MSIGTPATDVSPVRDALIHLTPLVPLVAGIAVVGQPAVWLGVLLPVGVLVLGVPLAGNRDAGRRHMTNALELACSIGFGLLATFVVVAIALAVPSIALLVPVGILAILMLAGNWIFLTAAATFRARRGEIHDHPFVFRLRDRIPWLSAR